ncbi:unnamed protein product [Rotaria sp. Silwood2]|nr:unnamed protein product [Rotaria sp. Silwood2]CAF2625765.1 unnamed protein product [Rotaria sp. Silwood2]CAF4072466.1 unnamed protein product [Rotaria sp. Silwood2]CAF4162620.1 unnamed protein product [Rotaria sp. Silwood2]
MSSSEETSSTSNNNQTSNSSSHHISDHEGGIHFNPPLYRQRYMFTLDMIQRDSSLHSLLDIGCGTCQLLTIGKYRNPHIQLIAAIDIIRYQLDEGCFRLKPLPVEYLIFRRETPLHMYVLQGDATKICNCFQHFDVVTLIEVIEHLYLNDLENLVKHVFGYICPRLVIITTPNADFNVLFTTMICGQFRHADHKFEFTRHEFNTWAQKIAHTYGYLVEFNGVGQAPSDEQYRNIGTCTQIAIFYRQNNSIKTILTSTEFYQRLSYCNKHELAGFIDYPYGIKKSTDIQEQIRYILDMYRLIAEDKARHGDDNHDSLPLTITFQTLINHPRLLEFNITENDLKQTIENIGYKMLDNNQIILSEDPLTYTHEDDYSNDHDQRSINNQNEIVKSNQEYNENEECWD